MNGQTKDSKSIAMKTNSLTDPKTVTGGTQAQSNKNKIPQMPGIESISTDLPKLYEKQEQFDESCMNVL